MSKTIIQVKNLNFYYAKEHVLHDVSVDFEANKITAILGPSGSGKSTLLRTINRIYELYPHLKAKGQIHYDGRSIFDYEDINMLRQEIGMVFQKPTVFPMTIFDNVAYAIKTHEKISKRELSIRVQQALEQAALWEEVKHKLHEAGSHLSGGQQQRLCIARTIAIRPKVLLLDEPTSALDPLATAKIESLVEQLKEQYTIIMVTHKLIQAKKHSDNTIFMRNGRIVEAGPTEQMFANPVNPETKTYFQQD